MADLKGSILVVDDEQVVLKSCERILKPEGYAVRTTASAQEALTLMKENSFDLVFTDLKLQDMDGLDLIRRIRKDHPEQKVVVITGYPSQESIKEALAMRILDYIPKPFSPSLLLDVASNAIVIKTMTTEEQDYTVEVADKLEAIIQKHKHTPGSLIPVLQEAQGLVGYLPPVVQRHIARGLNVPVSEVHGVVSFYSFFSMKPKGKFNIRICLGTACYVKRAEEIVDKLKKELKIDMGEVTEDRMFSLESVRCLGACGLAPVVVVDQETFGSINPVETTKILDHFRGGK